MPRNMSFFLTTEQVLNESKTVTRRIGWNHLQPGTYCWAVEKGQGLKKGEKIKRLKLIRILSVRKEPLEGMRLYPDTLAETRAEGFPEWTAHDFIEFFAKENKCAYSQWVNRIEFEYVKDYSGKLLSMSNAEVNHLCKHTIEPVYKASGLLQWRDDYNFFVHGADLKTYKNPLTSEPGPGWLYSPPKSNFRQNQ